GGAGEGGGDRTGWRTVGPTLGGFCIAWFGWQSALALQLAAGTHLVEVSIDVELKKIARVITRSTRSRRDRTHETQAGHVKAFGEGINHPHCCFSPDVVVYPCRQEACLLTVLRSEERRVGKECRSRASRDDESTA